MVTPLDMDDVERLSERLFREQGDTIRDRDSFDLAWVNFTGQQITNKQKRVVQQVFNVYSQEHDISKERLFKEAGGKDFRKDTQTTAKVIVDTEQQYKRRGAQRVDLRGFDVPDRKRFFLEGKVGKRVVAIRETSVVVRGKRVVRFRDSKGRFAKRIK